MHVPSGLSRKRCVGITERRRLHKEQKSRLRIFQPTARAILHNFERARRPLAVPRSCKL